MEAQALGRNGQDILSTEPTKREPAALGSVPCFPVSMPLPEPWWDEAQVFLLSLYLREEKRTQLLQTLTECFW
jgi:hypothetical protein